MSRMNRCIVCGNCPELSLSCTLFPFPDPLDDQEMYRKYLTACGIDAARIQTKRPMFVCNFHFQPECFVGDTKESLQPGSVPDVNLEPIEVEVFIDEDFEILDEYVPLFNIKQTVPHGADTDMNNSVQRKDRQISSRIKQEEEDDIMSSSGITIKNEQQDAPNDFEAARFCIICKTRESSNLDIRLYAFPKTNPRLLKKWLMATCIDEARLQYTDLYVCHKHFLESDFRNETFLRNWATPAINLQTENDVAFTKGALSIIIQKNPKFIRRVINLKSYSKIFEQVLCKAIPEALIINNKEVPISGTYTFESNFF